MKPGYYRKGKELSREPTAIVQAVSALVLTILTFTGYSVTADTITLIGTVCALAVPALISAISAIAIRSNVYSQESVWTVEEQHVERGRYLARADAASEIHSEVIAAVKESTSGLYSSLGDHVIDRMNREKEKSRKNETGVEEATGLHN